MSESNEIQNKSNNKQFKVMITELHNKRGKPKLLKFLEMSRPRLLETKKFGGC
jgi:hypothetical protein